MLMIFLLSIPITCANYTLDIDYLEDDDIIIDMTNMTINESATEGEWSQIEMISGEWAGKYLVMIESIDIEPVDYTFSNDTKTYIYDINNETLNDTLVVTINFSSIDVPDKPNNTDIENLTQKINSLQSKMENLNSTIENLTSNLSEANETINEKNDTIKSLEENLTIRENEYNQLESEFNTLNNDYTILENKYNDLMEDNERLSSIVSNLSSYVENLTEIVESQSDKIKSLEVDVSNYQSSLNELSSPFSTGYTDGEGNEHSYINITWLFIGGIIFSLILLLFLVYTGMISNAKTLKDIGNRFTIPFISSGEKPTPEEWEMIEKSNERPEVENEFFDNVKEQKEEKKEKIKQQKEEHESKKQQEQKENEKQENKKSNDSKKKSKKKNWWDTPAGKKRKAQMRKAGKGEL